MALKGLGKSERPEVEEKALHFINGVQQRVAAIGKVDESKRVFERYTFSLTKPTSDEIDRLSVVPRNFRASRSDIVKAGISALSRLSEEELVGLIAQVKQQK